MRNVYIYHRQDMDSVVAHAITCFYMDYYKRELKTVHLPDPGSFPWEETNIESRFFLVGITPNHETFRQLMDAAGDLIWIDNGMKRVTTILEKSTVEHNFRKIKGKRTGELSLCELTWDSYFAWAKTRPSIVDLVGRYAMQDVSRPDWDSRIIPFNRGLEVRNIDPLEQTVFEDFWKKILCLRRDTAFEAEIIEGITERGKTS